MKLFELIKRQAEQRGDAEAVVGGQMRLTYSQLEEKVENLAATLQGLGIGRGERVALLMPNNPLFIVGYFAVNRAGGVVVPINFLFKGEEVRYILTNAGARTILTLSPFKPLVDQLGEAGVVQRALFLDSGEQTEYRAGLNISSYPPVPEDVAVFLYTSGTTGRPKGAMLTNRNLIANVESLLQCVYIDHQDIFICVLPMFHSFAWTVCVLIPLFVGGKVVVQDTFQPQAVVKNLLEEKVTIFCAVPAIFAALAQATAGVKFPHLRLVISGGASLPLPVWEGFRRRFGIPLIEGYGLTEASPVVTLNPIEGIQKPGSIGLPIPRVEVRIVNEKGEDVALGEVGEIIVRGENVMKGYYNMPEATAEALRDGWLYTGDMAYRDEEGYIFIVDRKKDIIITGGLNVYPREVEEVLQSHPAVAEAAVVGEGDPLRGEVVKAFVRLKEGAEVNERELIRYCRERLANYKVPRKIRFVQEMPRNITGKVLKTALRSME